LVINLFTVLAGNTCSARAVSFLLEDFCDNFWGDPITNGGPHDTFMRQV